MQQTTLPAFLVVDDKVDGHFRAVGPLGFGRLLPVADRIAASVLGMTVVLVLAFPSGLHNLAFNLVLLLEASYYGLD